MKWLFTKQLNSILDTSGNEIETQLFISAANKSTAADWIALRLGKKLAELSWSPSDQVTKSGTPGVHPVYTEERRDVARRTNGRYGVTEIDIYIYIFYTYTCISGRLRASASGRWPGPTRRRRRLAKYYRFCRHPQSSTHVKTSRGVAFTLRTRVISHRVTRVFLPRSLPHP